MLPRFEGSKRGYYYSFVIGYFLTYFSVFTLAWIEVFRDYSILALYDTLQFIFGVTGFQLPWYFLYATLAALAIQSTYSGLSWLLAKEKIKLWEAQVLGWICFGLVGVTLFHYVYLLFIGG